MGRTSLIKVCFFGASTFGACCLDDNGFEHKSTEDIFRLTTYSLNAHARICF
ncbi:hypothetical protein ACB098_07G148200 [Castanea mollissima]